MKSFIFLIILAVSLNSCLNTQRGVVKCEKYNRMLLGEWIYTKDSTGDVTIKILPDTIIWKYKKKLQYMNRIKIINEVEDCNDDEDGFLSGLSILELEDNDDLDNSNRGYTRIHKVIYMEPDYMEWASGNNHWPWERKESNIQDSNFIQDSGTAIEMD